MASSIRAIGSVHYIEVVRSSDGPLSEEIPLYIGTKGTRLIQCLFSCLCRPEFGDCLCPHCSDKISFSQNHLCNEHLKHEYTIGISPRFWNRAGKMCLTWRQLSLNFNKTVHANNSSYIPVVHSFIHSRNLYSFSFFYSGKVCIHHLIISYHCMQWKEERDSRSKGVLVAIP